MKKKKFYINIYHEPSSFWISAPCLMATTARATKTRASNNSSWWFLYGGWAAAAMQLSSSCCCPDVADRWALFLRFLQFSQSTVYSLRRSCNKTINARQQGNKSKTKAAGELDSFGFRVWSMEYGLVWVCLWQRRRSSRRHCGARDDEEEEDAEQDDDDDDVEVKESSSTAKLWVSPKTWSWRRSSGLFLSLVSSRSLSLLLFFIIFIFLLSGVSAWSRWL